MAVLSDTIFTMVAVSLIGCGGASEHSAPMSPTKAADTQHHFLAQLRGTDEATACDFYIRTTDGVFNVIAWAGGIAFDGTADTATKVSELACVYDVSMQRQ